MEKGRTLENFLEVTDFSENLHENGFLSQMMVGTVSWNRPCLDPSVLAEEILRIFLLLQASVYVTLCDDAWNVVH